VGTLVGVMEVRAQVGTTAKPRSKDELIEALFRTQYPRLRSLAFVITGDQHRAEEVVMDAFLRTFDSWRRIRDIDAADRYLQRCVVNRARSLHRRRRAEATANLTAFQREETRTRASVTAQVWSTGDDGALLAAIRRLPARQMAAVVLRYYADLPEAEVASVLGCSVGTVKSQLARAHKRLAGLVEQSREES